MARAEEWQVAQFYPESCTECGDMGHPTAVIRWRLANDRTIREAFYSTDHDATALLFFDPPLGFPAEEYHDLLVAEHGALNDACSTHRRQTERGSAGGSGPS